jgi:RNA polymerase sigma-70 factor (ECF subfamily)
MCEGDVALLERWRAGDDAAGEALLARHFDAVCRFFRNKVGDGAPDLIQQTFLAACESRDRIRGDASFRTYLFGVARYVLLGHFRDKKKSADRLDPLARSVADAGDPSVGSLLGRRQEEVLLLQALRTLPLDLQIVFELYHLEGVTARELGEMYDLTEPGMYGRLRKARMLVEAAVAEIARTPALQKSTIHGLEDWAANIREYLAGDPRSDDTSSSA